MASEPATSDQPLATSHQSPATGNQPPATSDQPPTTGYQPSLGRKLFMFGLCIAGLIFVWTYYYFSTRPQLPPH